MPDPKRVKYRKILINKPFVLPMFPSFRSAGFPLMSYLPESLAYIHRAQYGDTMLVSMQHRYQH